MLLVYVQVNLVFDIGDMFVIVVIGLCYEEIEIYVVVLVFSYDGIYWSSINELVLQFIGDLVFIDEFGEYDNLLFSIDFKVDLIDDLVVCVLYSKIIFCFSYGDM